MRKRFLITGYFLNGYHGSVIHIAEMSKYLVIAGFDVYIASVEIKTEIKQYVEDYSGAKVYFANKLPLDFKYDYALGYHEPILSYLILRGLNAEHVGLGSLSNILDLEKPGFLANHNLPIFVHSKMLESFLVQDLKIKENNIYILPNSVPSDFMRKTDYKNEPQKIAIISNHVPNELIVAKNIFEESNITVDIYGEKYRFTPISSDILDMYDVIISIGKTVQYALYKGIPVYNYDHFGGAGYINLANIDYEESYNYSGRSDFKKLEGKIIAQEILDNYKNILREQDKLSEIAHKRYDWSTNIMYLVEILDKYKFIPPDTYEWNTYLNLSSLYFEKIISHNCCLTRIKNTILDARKFYSFMNKITFGHCYKNRLQNIHETIIKILDEQYYL